MSRERYGRGFGQYNEPRKVSRVSALMMDSSGPVEAGAHRAGNPAERKSPAREQDCRGDGPAGGKGKTPPPRKGRVGTQKQGTQEKGS